MAVRKSMNKIFSATDVMDNNMRSQMKATHETLATIKTLDEFNSYRKYMPVRLNEDVDPLTTKAFKKIEGEQLASGKQAYDMKTPQERVEDGDGVKSKGVMAIFNKLHAVPLEEKAYGWRVSQNMPLIDSPKTRRMQRSMNSCTVRDLVQKSRAGLMGTAMYEYSDFMFCKHLGRISNNHLITLRRFTIPCVDYIKPYGNPTAINSADQNGAKVDTKTDNGGIPLGCMVTWLGTPGNDMKDILKYSFNMPFKSVNSKWEQTGGGGGSPQDRTSKGMLGQAWRKGQSSTVARRFFNHIKPGVYNKGGGMTVSSPGPHYDANKAYAGVDMIKSIYIRDPDKGLTFQHKFKLVFEYELRSYDGINGKQAMLDLLGNILTVCYTTGDFWPGGYRSTGGGSSMIPNSSLECMQHHNTFSEYVKAFQHDFNKLKERFNNFMQDPLNNLLKLLDDLGGAILGGDLDAVPPAAGSGCNALLSDAAVGQWHVTIGNPCAPIMSIGNLILLNTEIEHCGPLGIDDFPTGLKVTCEFDTGKPRDKRLIERIYNGGDDRIYVPLDKSMADMLNHAKKINQKQAASIKGSTKAGPDADKTIAARAADAAEAFNNAFTYAEPTIAYRSQYARVDIADELNDADMMKLFFGSNDTHAIRWAAGEVSGGCEPSPASTEQTKKQ